MDLLGDEQHLRYLTRHDDALALRVVDRVGGGAVTLRVERDAERVDDGCGGFQPGLGGFAIGLDGEFMAKSCFSVAVTLPQPGRASSSPRQSASAAKDLSLFMAYPQSRAFF